MKEATKNNWKEVKGKIKNKFGKLSDSEIDGLQDNLNGLQSQLVQTYGYDQEKAKKEMENFKQSLDNKKDV